MIHLSLLVNAMPMISLAAIIMYYYGGEYRPSPHFTATKFATHPTIFQHSMDFLSYCDEISSIDKYFDHHLHL